MDSMLPNPIVKYKPVDAEQRPEWSYEDLANEGIHVFFLQRGPTPAPADIEIDMDMDMDMDTMWIRLNGLQVPGLRVSREPDGRILIQFDATTGADDNFMLRLPERLAKVLLDSLETVFRRS